MPLCHFAFGSLHRAGNLEEQTDSFVNKILLPRVLKAFSCPEFLPIINNPTARWAIPDSVRQEEGGAIEFERWVQSPPVSLLPCDVWMISFCDIPLNKLRTWSPSSHYGKLGIVFTNEFKARHRIKSVQYYELLGLKNDRVARAFNDAVNQYNNEERERLSSILLGYRKPAILWREFEELFGVLMVTAGNCGKTEIEKLTYSRYETGYAFCEEREARWVTSEGNSYLSFEEKDVFRVIVPDSTVGEEIKSALMSSWTRAPEVMIYPTDT